jgi:hypothetical protein
MNTSIPLETQWLTSHLAEAATALGVTVERSDSMAASELTKITRSTMTSVKLKEPSEIEARFSHEGFLERAKKLFVKECEVGVASFDDQIYVLTSTPEQTGRLLAAPRIQAALLALVDITSEVEIAEDRITLYDEGVPHDYASATAELLVIAAHLKP